MSKDTGKDVLSLLPSDVIRNILLDINYADVIATCLVNKTLARKVCTDDFWRLYGQKNLNLTLKILKDTQVFTWKELVRMYVKAKPYILKSLLDFNGKRTHNIEYIPFEKQILFIGERILINDKNMVYHYRTHYENEPMRFNRMYLEEPELFLYVSGFYGYERRIILIDIKRKAHLYITNKKIEWHLTPGGQGFGVTKFPLRTVDGNIFSEKVKKIINTTLLFTEKGEVWNILYQRNINTYIVIKKKTPIFVDFFSDMANSFGIDKLGQVWAKGNGQFYALGTGSLAGSPENYSKLNITNKIIYISAMGFHTYFLDENGDIWATGQWRRDENPLDEYSPWETLANIYPKKLILGFKVKHILGRYVVTTTNDIYELTESKEVVKVDLQGKKLVRVSEDARIYYLI